MADNIIVKDANGVNRTMRTSETAGVHTAAHSLIGSNGVEAGVTQYGYLRVTAEPISVFTEPFDSLDTTVRWTAQTASSGTAAVANGVLALSAGTTASARGGVSTQPTFTPSGLNFIALGCTLIIPTWTQANTKRFWGFGAVPGTPTVAVPVVNGCGFEIDGSGNFLAVVYETNVRTQAININSAKVPDNQPFYTAIARRADRIDYYINDTLTPVATVLIPTLDVSTLPGYLIAINDATAPAAAPTMNVTAFGIADTGMNSQAIKDPINPFLQATVTRPSTAAAAANSALAVALHPSSPLNGQSATGAAVAGNPVRIAGSDGTNTRNILTDAAGNLIAINPIPLLVTDVTSAAITTTATTAATTPSHGTAYQVVIPVTAVSGTPTLDVTVEESDDSGTNWFRVYDFPRITATGIWRSPKLTLRGTRVRYVQTVAGGTPSVTRSIVRLQYQDSVPQFSQIIDRTIVLTTLASSTPSVNVQGCRNAQLVINIGAATTAPALQLQGSDDNGATWYAIGSPLTAVASSTVQTTVTNVNAQLLRATVSTQGATVTAGYVLVKGF